MTMSHIGGYGHLWCYIVLTHKWKDSLFSRWCWDDWISTGKRMKVDPHPTPRTKINSEWITDCGRRDNENVTLGGKGELREQMELRWLIRLFWKREIILGYPGGPNITPRVLKCGRVRPRRKWEWVNVRTQRAIAGFGDEREPWAKRGG